MPKAIIQLTYRQLIDHNATEKLERIVFNQSFTEFTYKCQEYNPGNQYLTLAEMIANNPKANSLHYKVALSIFDTIKELNGIISGLTDSLNIANIPFEGYEMKILASNPFNQAEHVIAIDYKTPSLTLLEIVDGYFLLADSLPDIEEVSAPYQTFMLRMQQGLSISAYKEC